MKKNYKDKFNPIPVYSSQEKRMVCSTNYIEVGRECYHYEGLKKKKNDILVYSAILAGLNNKLSNIFSYNNKYIASRLNINDSEVRRSIRNLKELELIKVTYPSKNKRNIKVLIDLRYPLNKIGKRKSKKSIIKVYDRLFYYPMITKQMVHVYSYYLGLTNIPNYIGFSTVSYKKVAEALGYSERQVISIMNDMQDIGLIKIRHHRENKNIKAVKLEVNFSLKQPEVEDYEKILAQKPTSSWDDWEENTETKTDQQISLETSSSDQDKPIKKKRVSKYPPEYFEGW